MNRNKTKAVLARRKKSARRGLRPTVSGAVADYVARRNGPVEAQAPDGSRVVMFSPSQWSSIRETLYLLSIPGMRTKLLNGMQEPTSDLVPWDGK